MPIAVSQFATALADASAGRISRQQLETFLQKAVDNGDILALESDWPIAVAVLCLVEGGALKPSSYSKALEQQLSPDGAAMLSEMRRVKPWAAHNEES